jgi:hypothetical protein
VIDELKVVPSGAVPGLKFANVQVGGCVLSVMVPVAEAFAGSIEPVSVDVRLSLNVSFGSNNLSAQICTHAPPVTAPAGMIASHPEADR